MPRISRVSGLWSLLAASCLATLSLTACNLGGSDSGGGELALLDRPVAYVLREPVTNGQGEPQAPLLRDPAAFLPGATLILRDLASPSANERVLTRGLFDGPIDVRDLSVSFDGRRLLFALRAPEIDGAEDDEQPTWNIWQYDHDTGALQRIIRNDLIAEEGQDISPVYLPDGRILFASTRQRQARARLLDEGKPQFAPLEETVREHAFALHVMNPDGSQLRQISFNPSHDLFPMVMDDGRVLTLRWDNKQGRNRLDFHAMYPDGTGTGLLYGSDPQQADPDGLRYSQPRWLPGGELLVMARTPEGSWSGVPRQLAVQRFQRASQPLPGHAGDDAETGLLDLPLATTEGAFSEGGRVAALTPLFDGSGRYLVAWSPCRARQGDRVVACDAVSGSPEPEEAAPAYGLWIFDQGAGTQRPVVLPQPARIISDVAVLGPRSLPPVLADGQPGAGLDPALYDDLSGVLDIRSVFDVDGAFNTYGSRPAGVNTLEDYRDPLRVTSEERHARFLRVSKLVLIPDNDVLRLPGAAFGRGGTGTGMREVLGYVPVEPDGSVRVVVPANVPLDIQLVDAAGQALGNRHGNWLTVRPGETLTCNGCHTPNNATPHGRYAALPPPLNSGAPVTGLPFPNTDPALFADAGETMAQVRARLHPDDQRLTPDPVFDDIWTDTSLRNPDASLSLLYTALQTPLPVTDDCLADWHTRCRAIIHYAQHIQPLWDLPRSVDDNGTPQDVTCSACHTRRDAMSQLQVPPGQLELTGDDSGVQPLHAVSYRELLFADTELELVDGALIERLVQQMQNGEPVYELDEDGELRLDDDGNPIPVMVPVQLGQRLTVGNARASTGFFSRFVTGGSHAGWLTPEELRLISEWLDIGAQYYNDPFVVPQT